MRRGPRNHIEEIERMNLIDLIENQMIANRLPLVAVSLAAIPAPNTPTVLTLHWHGFVEVRLTDDTSQSAPVAYQAVPSSSLQVNERWSHLTDLDADTLETAWELGSWNLQRREARPFARPGAGAQETIEAMHAFGASPHVIDGDSPFVSETPDADELIDAASRQGYVQWLFRPVRGGLWLDVADDATLEPGGYRNPPCPLLPTATTIDSARTLANRERCWTYQFGRSKRKQAIKAH
jgi:hypothetical protein